MDEFEAEFDKVRRNRSSGQSRTSNEIRSTWSRFIFPHITHLSAYTIDRAMKVIVTGSYNHNLVHEKSW